MKAVYRDISPVTLRLGQCLLTSSLYCSSVGGLAGAPEEQEALLSLCERDWAD